VNKSERNNEKEGEVGILEELYRLFGNMLSQHHIFKAPFLKELHLSTPSKD